MANARPSIAGRPTEPQCRLSWLLFRLSPRAPGGGAENRAGRGRRAAPTGGVRPGTSRMRAARGRRHATVIGAARSIDDLAQAPPADAMPQGIVVPLGVPRPVDDERLALDLVDLDEAPV